MKVVFATATVVAGYQLPGGSRGTEKVTEGEAWDASHPVVVANPGLFADRPLKVRGVQTVVEQATAAPGEKRRVGRA